MNGITIHQRYRRTDRRLLIRQYRALRKIARQKFALQAGSISQNFGASIVQEIPDIIHTGKHTSWWACE